MVNLASISVLKSKQCTSVCLSVCHSEKCPSEPNAICPSKHNAQQVSFRTEVLSSDFPSLKISAASMTSVASTASTASKTSTASFHYKKFTGPDDVVIHSTQMTNTSPYLWNGSSKI